MTPCHLHVIEEVQHIFHDIKTSPEYLHIFVALNYYLRLV